MLTREEMKPGALIWWRREEKTAVSTDIYNIPAIIVDIYGNTYFIKLLEDFSPVSHRSSRKAVEELWPCALDEAKAYLEMRKQEFHDKIALTIRKLANLQQEEERYLNSAEEFLKGH